MAHHGHFEHNVETQALRTMSIRPVSLNLPSISEDELAADPDEPPEELKQTFTKTHPTGRPRKQSLLTKGLHTDTESHDENTSPTMQHMGRDLSRSSTCSSASMWSSNGFASDGGFTSSGTRASTPSSPPASVNLHHIKPSIVVQVPTVQSPPQSQEANASAAPAVHVALTAPMPAEPTVEAKLGRKRCITFACGRKQSPVTKPAVQVPAPAPAPAATPAKRPCALKFVCPMSKSSAQKPAKERGPRMSRHLSPAPPALRVKSPTPRMQERPHRDSDSTIINESPRSTRKSGSAHSRHYSNDSTLGKGEAMRFHEFGTSEEEVEDWVQESTCHKSRLTVSDTLKKENDIRETCQEAEEEALEEEAEEDVELEEDDDEAVSDEGFQTDDEEGFAESDDDDGDGDSDYEWWTHRGHSPHPTSLVPRVDLFRPTRRSSSTSMNSSSDGESLLRDPPSPRSRPHASSKRSGPVVIRPRTPELPDSTDFVCGTLDEDRPLEQAYLSCLAQRKATKQNLIPQDIDPTFPISDPDIESDEDSDVGVADSVQESDQHMFMHGRLENIDGGQFRGRRTNQDPGALTVDSPKRAGSPATITKRTTYVRSPAPRALFGHSPTRQRSPMPQRLDSPRGSPIASLKTPTFKPSHPFLGQRPQLTHTASLPRSPCPFARRSRKQPMYSDLEGETTAAETMYNRGAIDIVQGLEYKRLRRRQKFYEKYCRKEEKKLLKKAKRPLSGKGAQRMRQIGIECAEYRGKRVLSV